MPEPRFKPCMQDQPMLLPPDIGDLVPEGSMPRVVDMVVPMEAVRVLRADPTLDAFKGRASEMLHTERGSMLRRRRSVDVETIFGDIKRNWGFRRFLLRRLEKVDHEMRMVAMGHNIRKMAYALAV